MAVEKCPFKEGDAVRRAWKPESEAGLVLQAYDEMDGRPPMVLVKFPTCAGMFLACEMVLAKGSES